VPRLVSDEGFWSNATWRVQCLRQAKDATTAMALLRLLNTEPSPKPTDDSAPRLKNVGLHDNAAALDQIDAEVHNMRQMAEWAANKRDTIVAEIASSRSNLHLLCNVMTSSAESGIELAESVRDSCAFHKSKLAGHIVDLENRGDSLPADMVAPSGQLFKDLLQANEELHIALREFVSWREAAVEAAARGSPGTRQASSPLTSGPAVAGEVATAPTNDAFQAHVPWDDEDD
jgi:hypothetical protein